MSPEIQKVPMQRGRRHSKETRAKVISFVANGMGLREVSKETGLSYYLICRWAREAGLSSRKSPRKKRKYKTRAPLATNKTTARSDRAFKGELGTITALLTDPSLNSNQKVKMALAYLDA